MDGLSVVTCNINGINCPRKRKAVYEWLQRAKYDIIFLKETHCCHERQEELCGHSCGVGERIGAEGWLYYLRKI
jgi:exonuclease III